MADELVITEIKKEYGGDTFFPEYRDEIGKTWKETWREDHEEFSFVKYERVD
jgi:dihydrofolate reductase